MPRCSAIDNLECSVAAARIDAVLDNTTRPRDPLRFENAATDAVDILIYGQIIDDVMAEFFESGISAAGFARQLQGLKGKTLNVHVNSPGGLVFGGLAIYNLLRQHDAPVHVIVDGIAASIASVIAMAGDTVVMAPHAMMMIHEAFGMTVGNAADHKQMAEILGKESDAIAAVYAERADKRINWRQKMADETWFSDKEAVAAGLADRIDTTVGDAQRNSFDLSHFTNVPADLVGMNSQTPLPTKRTIEKLLRDAGVKGDRAKAFISAGWAALEARDEPEEEPPPKEEPTIETPVVETPPAVETPPSTTGTVVEDDEPEPQSDLAQQFARFQETKTIYRVEATA
jgi:ATP-dependent protease ClpP protease subunit